jgi:hypothetical protein
MIHVDTFAMIERPRFFALDLRSARTEDQARDIARSQIIVTFTARANKKIQIVVRVLFRLSVQTEQPEPHGR